MTTQRDLSKITSNGKEWGPVKPILKVNRNHAFDTETDVNGDIYLIAHSDTSRSYPNYLLFPTIDDILNLLTERRFCVTNNFWWNAKFDHNAIIKLLPHDVIEELLEVDSAKYKNFKLTFFPNKMLKVCRESHCSTSYDLAQFYDFKSLASLASLTSIGSKMDIDDIGDIDVQRIRDDRTYRDRIISRCTTDAIITKELADQFTDKVSRVVNVNKYLSPASIAKQYFRENLKRVQYPRSSPEILQGALWAYHGGFIDVLQVGTFYKAMSFDINAAYPYIMANLLSCEGSYINDANYRDDAAYSFFNVVIDYEDEYISPLFFEPKKDVIYHANGKQDVWITGIEYDWLIRNGFDFKVIEGRHLLRTTETYKPFKDLIYSLYDKRLSAKDRSDRIEKAYKLILNSAYGSTISTNRNVKYITLPQWEANGANPYNIEIVNGWEKYTEITYRTSPMFNPLFAAYITAGTRVQLLDAVFKQGVHVISFNTDAVFVDRKIKVSLTDKIGDWKVDRVPELNMFGSGRFFVKDDDAIINLHKSKFRGARGSSDVGNYLGISKLDVIDDMLQSDPEGLGASLAVTQVKGLKESIINGNVRDTCVFNHKAYTISYNLGRRLWSREFTKNEQFFDSNMQSSPLSTIQAQKIC